MNPDDAQHEQDLGDEHAYWPTESARLQTVYGRLEVLEQQIVVLTGVCATQAEQINTLINALGIVNSIVKEHTGSIRDINFWLTRSG